MESPRGGPTGYFSTDEETYYVAHSGAVYLVGSVETDGAVWELCEGVPQDAEPSDFDPDFLAEVEQTRRDRGIG